jgi:competence transcription factor ComK
MTQKELSLEIEVNDIINSKYRVREIFNQYAVATHKNRECKFNFIGRKQGYNKIMTVSRDGIVYYEAFSHGGYRHGRGNNN